MVLPISREMRPSLYVLYNWKNQDWDWKFHLSNGAAELALGPGEGGSPEARIKPVVVFRWSSEEKRFVGPPGGIDGDFLRIDSGDYERDLRELERRFSVAEEDHSRF
jgi:hypothetical protein